MHCHCSCGQRDHEDSPTWRMAATQLRVFSFMRHHAGLYGQTFIPWASPVSGKMTGSQLGGNLFLGG